MAFDIVLSSTTRDLLPKYVDILQVQTKQMHDRNTPRRFYGVIIGEESEGSQRGQVCE